MPHYKGLTATILPLTDLRYAATANSLEDRCNAQRDQSRRAGKAFVPFFFIFLPQGPVDAYLSESKEVKEEAKGGEGTSCSCKLLLPAERIRVSVPGRWVSFINVHFACYAIHHRPAEHDFPALLAIAAS
ncbi:uncharacterized protein TrAFT101_004536 [Trichoderma asperellum]|uniref:uncharacterized protein n=1 Tax=Trichoderma asperellum TaxID=101201 RepID=UPI003318F9B5|nr:hypothetical protein TrAFT101_004536 [Trichoderma asperellum]